MAGWKDVRRIALSLPETTEKQRGGHAAWSVRDKVFVWERPLRPADLAALGDRATRGAILGVRVPHLLAKEARLAAQPEVCFTTPHFDGYPALLVRLGKIRVAALEELIVEAWLVQAPRRLARAHAGHA
jgi:hypothetical protein